MQDRFTERVRKVMYLAREEAGRLHHDYIGTEHLLLGIIREGEGIGATALQNLGLDLDTIRQSVENMVPTSGGTLTIGEIPFAPRATRVLELSVEEARMFGHNYVGTEHLLLGLIREGEGVAARILMELGADRKRLREEILKLLGGKKPAPRSTETPVLDSFGRDLTQLALDGSLDPIVGREEAVRRVARVLLQRAKHNPVLVGAPGVGRKSIVHGLAWSIVAGSVPERLKSTRLVVLHPSVVGSGAKEEQMRGIVAEVSGSENIVLVVENMAVLEDPRASSLKRAVIGGSVQCILVTTPDGFRAALSRDASWREACSEIRVQPPSVEETEEIIRSLRPGFEEYYRVKIPDDVLRTAVDLARMYVREEQDPARVIALIDEAGARAQLGDDRNHAELRSLEAELERTTREKEAAIAGQDFERGASLRDGEKQLRRAIRAHRSAREEESRSVARVLSSADLVKVISDKTGLPPTQIEERRPLRSGDGPKPESGVPLFERHQTGSVFQGNEVRVERGFGFVLIPHNKRFRELYDEVICPALEACGLRVLVAEDIFEPGPILSQVWAALCRAEVIVADVTDQNPNVIMELGLCYGLGRFPILLAGSVNELPYNLRFFRCIEYQNTVAGAAQLRKKLEQTVREFLAAVRTDGEETAPAKRTPPTLSS